MEQSMNIFQVMILFVAALQAACVGTRTYTEQEKLVLERTRTIWVEVNGDHKTIPTGTSGLLENVERHVKERLTRSGLTVASDKRSADADLRLDFDFTYRKPFEGLPSGDTEYSRNTLVMHIEARLNHKDVGQLFRHDDVVSPPYDLNFSQARIIKYVDSDVLEALFKSAPPATKTE
jgi:hypothetical protein